MTTKTQTILVCDFCGTESDDVTTQRVSIDARTMEAEACGRCWPKISKGFDAFTIKARKVARRGRPARTATAAASGSPRRARKTAARKTAKAGA